MKRSLFGFALCYNKLSQQVVDSKSVSLFQAKLQQGLLLPNDDQLKANPGGGFFLLIGEACSDLSLTNCYSCSEILFFYVERIGAYIVVLIINPDL